MKKLLALLTLTVSSLALASTWEIDPNHSSANFTVIHLMVTKVHGSLGPVKGTVDLDDKDVTKSKVDVSIDINGVDTGVAKRDADLRSDHFFDVQKFPTATFKSTKIEKAGDKLKVTGDLTMHGVTKPVTLDAELTNEVVNPMSKAPTRAVTATTTLNREDWGLTYNMPMANGGFLVSKDVKVSLEIEMDKKGAEKAAAPAAPKK